MKKRMTLLSLIVMTIIMGVNTQDIMHDAEQYILIDQYGDKWDEQDKEIEKKLDALYKKHGKRPNIVHIMWDDNSFGEVGIKEFNLIRGFDTPRLNQMAEDGITFTRMYTEPSCTPTRAGEK